jgi:hypothetical protein
MYDIVFISYQEPNADENWIRLKSRFPFAKRVHGVKGIHQAHIAAASYCFTDMIWVVDGDAIVLDTFNFDYKPHDLEYVFVWRSRNAVNDLEYGNGGIKLLPRKKTINMDLSKPDMTTSISDKFRAVQELSNINSFNTDPFNTWKSAFRECTKLASAVIDRQKQEETDIRLDAWCTVGKDKMYGGCSIKGAIAGRSYGIQHKNNLEALKKINDFEWLDNKFKELT